jgi:hypothetical protein
MGVCAACAAKLGFAVREEPDETWTPAELVLVLHCPVISTGSPAVLAD